MEVNQDEIERHLNAFLNGRPDQITKQVIEGWISDKQNLPAFYDRLLRFESDHPMIRTNVERALKLCKNRLA